MSAMLARTTSSMFNLRPYCSITSMGLGLLLLSVACTVPRVTVAQLPPHSESPCGKDFGGCDTVNGLCWGTSETTHFCTCKAGFLLDASSQTHKCTDVDECSEGACSADSVCENTLGSFKCHCRCGYMLDYTGEHCLLVEEIEGLCEIPDKCIIFSDKGKDHLITDETSLKLVPSRVAVESCGGCEDGFRQNACGYCEDIDECIEGSHDCSGVGSACRNLEGHYYCECESNYVLCGKRCYGVNEEMPASCTDVDDIKWLSNEENEAIQRDHVWCEFLRNFDSSDNRIDTDCRRSNDEIILLDQVDGWEEWTCWSVCKPTCWGGLQTRTRKCRNGVVGIDCKGRGSESKECYSGQKCPFRVRKDVNSLTPDEIEDLLQAMEKFKNDDSTAGFHNAASSHGWPKQCNGEECCPHGARLKFVSWHRSTMLNVEKGLTRHLRNKYLGLPYWNWLAEDQTPPDLTWSKEINGHPNPFANMTVRIDLEGPMRTVQRDRVINLRMMKNARDQWFGVTASLMKPNTMAEFTESLESVHGIPHTAICTTGGRCGISMASIFYAGFDPIFMFHHTQIDRLWAVFQKKLEDDDSTAWTLDTVIETGEKRSDFGRPQMPFGNYSINPYPILKAVNNMRDSYYYKELTGVVYDTLDNDGMPPEEPETPTEFHGVLIAHYLESFHAKWPVYVNYYVLTRFRSCANLRNDSRIGGGVLMSTHRNFQNHVPNLLPAKLNAKQKTDENIELKACYTYKPGCTSRCPSVKKEILRRMATPALMIRYKGSDSQLFKFNWSPGNVMPWWPINFLAHSQFVNFYGSRASHIKQVSNYREWDNCDSSKATQFPCEAMSPCRLQIGVYYIIDTDYRLCKNGLRMIAVSTFRE